jgi:hypothetical protein
MMHLLSLAVDHMLANKRIILHQFQPRGVIAAVFLCVVHVAALATLHLHDCAVTFFRHFSITLNYEPKAFDGA